MLSYSIITPVKNEIQHFTKTFESVCSQSFKPIEWIIVDDGSSDGTKQLINELVSEHNWIVVLDAPNLKQNDYSSRVIDLFNYGYNFLSIKVDLICKLDADVSFNIFFFQNIQQLFIENTQLAITSGLLHTNGIAEKFDNDHEVCTRGATKVYRRSFLEEIGGLVSYQGWDTLDNVAARAKGWQVMQSLEPFEHLKKEGARVGKLSFQYIRTGFYNGALPFYTPYFIIKLVSKFFKKPIILGSFYLLYGFLKAKMSDSKSPYPEYMIKQLRSEQKAFLLKKVKLV